MPLNNVARAAIEELRGLGVTDLTPDEVVRLNDLGAAQLKAGRERDGIALTPPVKVGNVLLYPITCAGSDFLERMRPGVAEGTWLSLLLVPFTMAHGRNPLFLESICSTDDLYKAVTSWMRTTTATISELGDGVSRVIDGDTVARDADLRIALLSFCAGVEGFDPQSANIMLSLGKRVLAGMDALAEQSGEHRGSRDPDDAEDRFWYRKFAAELGALTGVSPDYWYAQDRRLAAIAYRKARERATLGQFGNSATGKDCSPELVVAIKRLREAVAGIVKMRQARAERETAQTGETEDGPRA